jgi:uncharacterized membrane protein YkvA (DUF1232 family)
MLRTLVSHVRVTLRLLREPCVPLLFKTIPFFAAAYVISPLDFVPDVLPIVGQLDDLGIIFIALETFLRLAPSSAVEYHRAAVAQGRPFGPMPADGEVINAQYRRHEL